MQRQEQLQPLPRATSAELRDEKMATKLAKPFTKLFRDRGPARRQDRIRQKLRESIELPPSSSFDMPPRPLMQQKTPMQIHPYNNLCPNDAPFDVSTPYYPSRVLDGTGYHDQHASAQVPSRINATHLERPQESTRSQTPLSITKKGGASVRWAKKVFSPLSRPKPKQQTATPENAFPTTLPDAYVRQQFRDDSLSSVEEPAAPLRQEPNKPYFMPHFGLRRKPLPESTSFDSHLTDLHFSQQDESALASDSRVDNRRVSDKCVANLSPPNASQSRDNGKAVEQSRQLRMTFNVPELKNGPLHHPFATQRIVAGDKQGSTPSYPNPRQQHNFPEREVMRPPAMLSQAITQKLATFTSQSMTRPSGRLQPLYLSHNQQPEQSEAANASGGQRDGARSLSEWHRETQEAVKRLDNFLADTPISSSTQGQQNAGPSIRITPAQDQDNPSEKDPTIDHKHVVVPERRSSSEVQDAATPNAPVRVPMSTHSSAVNAFELEKRLNSLEAAGRLSQSPQCARKALPTHRRGFAEKMLSGDDNIAPLPLSVEKGTDVKTSALGLHFTEQGDASRLRNTDTVNNVLDARLGLRVLYRNRTPMPGNPQHGIQMKRMVMPPATPMPQLGLRPWNEAVHPPHHDRDDVAGAGVRRERNDGQKSFAAGKQASIRTNDSHSISLSPSQNELVDRMEVWREDVAHMPRLYAPSASASVRVDGKAEIRSQQIPDMTSISRSAQIGESLSVVREGAVDGDAVTTSVHHEPMSSFSTTPNRSHLDLSQHISFHGPASELVKFMRGSMDLADRIKEGEREQRRQQSTWKQPREELLIDLDDQQAARPRTATSPPVAFGTRHIRQMSDKDSQHLINMVGDRLSATHSTKSMKCDTPAAEPDNLTPDETMMLNVLNNGDSDGLQGVDLILRAYRKELHDFLRKDPRMFLLVKLRSKMGKDTATGAQSSPTGNTQHVPSVTSLSGRGQKDAAAAASARFDEERLGKAMQSTVANASGIGELSRVHQSLIELHRDVLACINDCAQREALKQRLASLEKAVFAPA